MMTTRRQNRGGQALLEFGIISFLLFTIVIGTLSYGIQLWQAIMLQQAVDSGAIAASRVVLPPNMTFEQALVQQIDRDSDGDIDDPGDFRLHVYDPKYLVVNDSELPSGGLFEFMRDKPILNRLLSPAFVRDGSRHRYPGTLVTYTDFGGTTEETVLIPVVDAGGDIAQWRFPVEEITNAADQSVFDVDSGTTLSGLATLRVNYPYQSATAIAWRHRDSDGNPITADQFGSAEVRFNEPILASSPAVAALPTRWGMAGDGPAVSFTPDLTNANKLGPFSGAYGLGRVVAGGQVVRPFRQVMTFQAARLREVFGAP